MPPSPIQSKVLLAIAKNRTPESMIAGGLALNQHGPRYSNDIDIFQDNAKALPAALAPDHSALHQAGCQVKIERETRSFVSATVSNGVDSTEIDWAVDSSYRFFPAMPDHQYGYKLHLFDLATMKALAAAGRSEARDSVDLLMIDRHYVGLGAVLWAAVAKDEGYSPQSLASYISRFSGHSEAEYARLALTKQVSAKEMKGNLLEALSRANTFFEYAPPESVGHVFLDRRGRPSQPGPGNFSAYTLHAASSGGIWPMIPDVDATIIEETLNDHGTSIPEPE
jgi:hypothetical protein